MHQRWLELRTRNFPAATRLCLDHVKHWGSSFPALCVVKWKQIMQSRHWWGRRSPCWESSGTLSSSWPSEQLPSPPILLHLWKYVPLAVKIRLSWSAQRRFFHGEWLWMHPSNLFLLYVPLLSPVGFRWTQPLSGQHIHLVLSARSAPGQNRALISCKNIGETVSFQLRKQSCQNVLWTPIVWIKSRFILPIWMFWNILDSICAPPAYAHCISSLYNNVYPYPNHHIRKYKNNIFLFYI